MGELKHKLRSLKQPSKLTSQLITYFMPALLIVFLQKASLLH
jgi:hypothetical protein